MLDKWGWSTDTVGFVTGNAYAGRGIDAIIAGLRAERTFVVSMYGRAQLASVQGKDVPAPVAINQIPSELHNIWRQLLELEAELDKLESASH